MRNHTFSVIVEKDEGGSFVGRVPELISCSTQGDSLPELLANVREAIAVCLESLSRYTFHYVKYPRLIVCEMACLYD